MSDSPQMTKRRPLLAAEAAEATPYSLVVEGVPQFSSTRRALPRLRAALSYVSAGLLFAIFVLYMLPANLALVERPPQTGAACARDVSTAGALITMVLFGCQIHAAIRPHPGLLPAH